jgi:hypothetical protein
MNSSTTIPGFSAREGAASVTQSGKDETPEKKNTRTLLIKTEKKTFSTGRTWNLSPKQAGAVRMLNHATISYL